jgi:hypothetical protein
LVVGKTNDDRLTDRPTTNDQGRTTTLWLT